MSFTWRYVVRPDGSFCRVSNLDGSLDNVSDEELAQLHPEWDEDEQPGPGPAPAAAATSCHGTAR